MNIYKKAYIGVIIMFGIVQLTNMIFALIDYNRIAVDISLFGYMYFVAKLIEFAINQEDKENDNKTKKS